MDAIFIFVIFLLFIMPEIFLLGLLGIATVGVIIAEILKSFQNFILRLFGREVKEKETPL